jgi:transposase-like protein
VAPWLVVPGSTVSSDVETLRRLYVDEGLSLAAMAGRLGVAAQTVHNWLVAGGVPRRPSPARFRSDIDDGEIIRLYTHEGHTAAEIAEPLGCSTSLVYARLARRGVDRRPQARRRRPGPTGARPPVQGLWAQPARTRGALRGDHPGGARLVGRGGHRPEAWWGRSGRL